ncbi:hypothetical protein Pla175_42720 [Pirellulimonas nuda]|uniref:Uncharacterized protein n=1 Tax=Pirellulimonas nuda TaxID=2528009 RepID=A0A518DHB6_9BACT|nr:hypothetical protein [Pirellulimonas nuda]QDU90859.1 hypothetical protein Pla175_42720 [Pirellulimonas nuda]
MHTTSTYFSLASLLVLLAGPCFAAEPLSPHPVVNELATEGFEVAEGVRVIVSPPTVDASMDAEAQRAAVAALVGELRMEQFMKDSVVSPFELSIGEAGAELPSAKVRTLDLAFVAYGKLAVVRDKDLMQSVLGGGRGGEGREAEEDGFEKYGEGLTQQECQERGFDLQLKGASRHHLTRFRFPLIEKVMIAGIVEGDGRDFQAMLVESSMSPVSMLDDKDFPTVWQEIPRGAQGDEDLGEPQPWRGLAGYLQTTELKFEPGAILVECHGVFVEPYDWFKGRNLLASKLPIVVKNNVTDFRRKLAKASEEVAE